MILAIDQGTSSSRAVLYGEAFAVIASAQQEFPQIYPSPGWVEHDPEAIWSSITDVVITAREIAGIAAESIAAIGITNQRETTIIWDRDSGQPIYNAIVWQDRRTASYCRSLIETGVEATVTEKTGLRLDPYFSASKIAWILDNVAGAREKAAVGRLAFGTIDSFLMWRLSSGKRHVTDATNASRTLLFNIHTQQWDAELLELFDIPENMLPEVLDCIAEFAVADDACVGASVPILGVAGDQQAALIGQVGFESGMTKCTYGTGCFAIANTGSVALASQHQLLTTIAMRLNGVVTYGLEGSVFVAGSAMQWLRDELGILATAEDSEAIAKRTGVVDDVVVVPAFAGLGAPFWDPDARGAIFGLTRGSGRDSVITATLQAVAYQTVDLMQAMSDDGIQPCVVRVDGGMVANDWFLQFLADVLAIPVERPTNTESTVLGAAYLASVGAGLAGSLADIDAHWRSDRVFQPAMSSERRAELIAGWHGAVQRVRTIE